MNYQDQEASASNISRRLSEMETRIKRQESIITELRSTLEFERTLRIRYEEALKDISRAARPEDFPTQAFQALFPEER